MFTFILTGPTCSGKSAVAYALARQTGGEIVSLDSMKVYKGMDVGTAKPPASVRAEFPFHLVDVVLPSEQYNVGRFVREAICCASEILRRRRKVIFAGGTPLYLRALIRGFCAAPQGDRNVRARIAKRIVEEGLHALHAELAAVDPAAASKIHPNDKRRISRALEVYYLTGRPFTEFWQNSVIRLPPATYRVFGLNRPRDSLYRRINRRVDRMVSQGLFEEARRIPVVFGKPSRTAGQCIGYREIWQGLAEGQKHEEIVRRIKLNTRRFARKQLTWFRGFPEIEWLEAEGREAGELADRIIRRAEPAGRALNAGSESKKAE